MPDGLLNLPGSVLGGLEDAEPCIFVVVIVVSEKSLGNPNSLRELPSVSKTLIVFLSSSVTNNSPS